MASSEAGPSRQTLDAPADGAGGAGAASSSSSLGQRAGVQQPQPQRRPRPRIAGQGSGSTILVNSRQRGNPVLKGIKNVGWEFADIIPDYQVGPTSGVLFLSLRYHRLHPEYIHQRISNLGTMFSMRILLVQCDVNDHQPAIKELTKIALINNLTMMVAWTPEDVGRYIETYKSFEHKPPDIIKERVGEDYLSQLNSVLTSVRGVNKTDVMTLASNFGSLKRVTQADADELSTLAGFGDIKVKRLREAFTQPFRVGGEGAGRTLRQRKAREALEAAERGEELPGMGGAARFRSISRAPSAVPRDQDVDALEMLNASEAAADAFLARHASRPAESGSAATGSKSAGTSASASKSNGNATDRQEKPSAPAPAAKPALSAALAAAAAFRDDDDGYGMFARAKASKPQQRDVTSPQRQGAREALATDRTAAPDISTDEDDASLWKDMPVDDLRDISTGDASAKGAPTAADKELSLEDFENLTEEEQLQMALAMSTAS